MDWLWINDQFLGVEWNTWKVIGWLGNVAFFSRFFVQWYASERQKQVVVPVTFWWLSLVGSLLLLLYALFYKRDSVFIFAYAFTWIPYIRNLVIQHRARIHLLRCSTCQTRCPEMANFCHQCGTALKRNPTSAPGEPTSQGI